MIEGWTAVYRSAHEYQAALIADILEEHGLHPVIMDRKDDEFLIGDVEVYVAPEEAEQAKRVIGENATEEE